VEGRSLRGKILLHLATDIAWRAAAITSNSTSWNAKQFTREMEGGEEMRAKVCGSRSKDHQPWPPSFMETFLVRNLSPLKATR